MTHRYRKLLLASASSAFALFASVAPTGVMAQSAPAPTPDAPAPLPKTYVPETKADTNIVVTGSRIRRNNFDTPSEVNVITKDDFESAGYRDIATALQSSTVTSGTSQINGSFLGFGVRRRRCGKHGGPSRTRLVAHARPAQRATPSAIGRRAAACCGRSQRSADSDRGAGPKSCAKARRRFTGQMPSPG